MRSSLLAGVLLVIVPFGIVLAAGCAAGAGGGGGGGGVAECASDAACDDGDLCTTDACVNDRCVNVPIEGCEGEGEDEAEGEGEGESGQEGQGWVTFALFDGHVYRIEAVEGAKAEDVSLALDEIAPGAGDDGWLNISPDGEWLILETDRFDPDCVGWACLALVTGDLSGGEAVHVGGEAVHADFSAVGSGGNLIVYPMDGGPHETDLYAITRDGGDWSDPVLLTADSPYAHNNQPAVSADGANVVFNCGPEVYGHGQGAICEVGIDASGFSVILTPEDAPPGLPDAESLHYPDYGPDGSVVFEGEWDGERIWRVAPGASIPTTAASAASEYINDNCPCVLPDGRIASLTYGLPDGHGEHEIKIMSADGESWFMLFRDADVVDGGIGCGGSGEPLSEDDEPDPDSEPTGYFPSGAVWYEDISSAPLDAQSDEVITWLEDAGGWGADGTMRIDSSIEVLHADADTPVLAFTPTEDHYTPDCDTDAVPVPDGGALEGEAGYECESDGDCHLIVVDQATNQLFEMWRANIVGDDFFGGCLAVWDMTRVYGPSGRGENCTSADAAGYPIAPLLFSADEVAAGSIEHAIRFILPNDRIRERVYVHPATHSTGATSGPDSAPPYGARFRLRADFPLDSLPNEGARVVARALQRYGMFLSDAGQIALTGQSDRFTTAKWADLLDTRDLEIIQVGDFEMVEAGERFEYTGDCVREP